MKCKKHNRKYETDYIGNGKYTPPFCRQCMRDTKSDTLSALLERLADEGKEPHLMYIPEPTNEWGVHLHGPAPGKKYAAIIIAEGYGKTPLEAARAAEEKG